MVMSSTVLDRGLQMIFQQMFSFLPVEQTVFLCLILIADHHLYTLQLTKDLVSNLGLNHEDTCVPKSKFYVWLYI